MIAGLKNSVAPLESGGPNNPHTVSHSCCDGLADMNGQPYQVYAKADVLHILNKVDYPNFFVAEQRLMSAQMG